jgi:hypothetical protein
MPKQHLWPSGPPTHLHTFSVASPSLVCSFICIECLRVSIESVRLHPVGGAIQGVPKSWPSSSPNSSGARAYASWNASLRSLLSCNRRISLCLLVAPTALARVPAWVLDSELYAAGRQAAGPCRPRDTRRGVDEPVSYYSTRLFVLQSIVETLANVVAYESQPPSGFGTKLGSSTRQLHRNALILRPADPTRVARWESRLTKQIRAGNSGLQKKLTFSVAYGNQSRIRIVNDRDFRCIRVARTFT